MTTPTSEKTRRPDGAAFVIAGLLAALGALLLWEAGRIPVKSGYAGIGSADALRLVGFCLVGLALWTAIAGWRGAFEARPQQKIPPLLWIVAGLSLQLILLHPAGFSIASGILFACTAAAFGERRMLLTLPIGIAFAFAVYGIFDQLLKLNLPGGPLENLIYGG